MPKNVSLLLSLVAAFPVFLMSRDITTVVHGTPGPALRLTYPETAVFGSARLELSSNDPSGFAELEILAPAHELRYQTEAVRAGPEGKFTRTILLSDLFPTPPPPGTLRLEVKLKNTKGQTVSAFAVIRLEK